MSKRMLVDATHPEETRVAVVSGNRLEELDFEIASRRQLKGNVYLAKVIRVEPSLQAAFVEYGGNRHGFLAFSEIHPDYYRIPVEDRAALLAEEERLAAQEARRQDAMAERAEREANGQSGGQSERGERDRDRGGRRGRRRRGEPREGAPQEGLREGFGAIASEAPEAEGLDEIEAVETGPDFSPAVSAPEITDDVFAPETTHGEAAAEEEGDESTPKYDGPARPAVIDGESVSESADNSTDQGDAADPVVDEFGLIDALDTETPPAPVAPPMGYAASADAAEEVDDELDGGLEGEIIPPDEFGARGFDDDLETDEDEDEDDEEGEDGESRPRRARPIRSYKIQEVIKRRQILLIQVTKEERGNKGAALTTYLSLPGRYCVLMPNTGRGGGISRKITNPADRRRLKDIMSDLDIPDGMAVILRTAGLERAKPEIKRDLEYLLRLWDDIREQTLKSVAPALIYEEANLIKRAIRDVYSDEIEEVLVDGEGGFRVAQNFMRMMMPSHASRVQLYRDQSIPLFHRYQVETQIDAIHSPVVQLRSGGYIVINPTEALVAIDVNSGRSTRERNIEETAFKTNLEAADEVARQLRLRDLAGLIVVDFIDMEDPRNNAAVERRIKDAMRNDRARIQVGRISMFGLLELSRQRLRPSLQETNFEPCPHCAGTGIVRSVESAALHVLRAIEDEGTRRRSAELQVHTPTRVALYVLNQKRADLSRIEARHDFRVVVAADDSMTGNELVRIERTRARTAEDDAVALVSAERVLERTDRDLAGEEESGTEEIAPRTAGEGASEETVVGEDGQRRRRRRRRRGGRDRDFAGETGGIEALAAEGDVDGESAPDGDDGAEIIRDMSAESEGEAVAADGEGEGQGAERRGRRRRGRRGGRRERMAGEQSGENGEGAAEGEGAPPAANPPVMIKAVLPPVESVPDLAPIDFDLILDGETGGEDLAELDALVPPPPATETAPEEATNTEVAAEPVPEEDAPAKGRKKAAKPRKSRSKKAAVDAPVDAPPAEAPPADVATVEEEATAKPAKRKSRSKKAAAEDAPVDAPPAEADSVEEAPAKPAKRKSRSKKAAAEDAPVDAPPAEAPPTEPEVEKNAAARAAEKVNEAPTAPRKGWWSR